VNAVAQRAQRILRSYDQGLARLSRVLDWLQPALADLQAPRVRKARWERFWTDALVGVASARERITQDEKNVSAAGMHVQKLLACAEAGEADGQVSAGLLGSLKVALETIGSARDVESLLAEAKQAVGSAAALHIALTFSFDGRPLTLDQHVQHAAIALKSSKDSAVALAGGIEAHIRSQRIRAGIQPT
jgi:hypothetical protein